MEDNNTNCLCEICNSPIFAYTQDHKLIFECVYCGTNSNDPDDDWDN